MGSCCNDKCDDLGRIQQRQRHTLRIVLLVNAAMFAIELAFGLLSGSLALLADSLDMLTDALVYGLSLYVVSRGVIWKARAALVKAAVMALSGAFVLAQVVYKIAHPALPTVGTMGAIGALALVANGLCFGVLWRHRAHDVNMRSVWLCSRNDLAANGLVLCAAAAVSVTGSPWPDIAAGAFICGLFLRSALSVMKEAHAELVAQRQIG